MCASYGISFANIERGVNLIRTIGCNSDAEILSPGKAVNYVQKRP